MDRMETQKIINKIKTFRQSFLVEKDTVDNWLNVLKDYDYKDVDKKLDEYFKESNNFGQYPDPYYLTKYLIKNNEKFSMSNIIIKCGLCGETVLQAKFQEHFDRCSSIDYICNMSEKFYNKKLDKKELYQMQSDKFDKAYWNFCENLFNKMPDGLEKRALENALLTHKGRKPRFDIEELTN